MHLRSTLGILCIAEEDGFTVDLAGFDEFRRSISPITRTFDTALTCLTATPLG